MCDLSLPASHALPPLPPPPLCRPQEIREIESGKADKANNILKHAPHAPGVVLADKWERPYSRERAAFPAPWVRQAKFWPTVSRVDNVYGDRHLITRWDNGTSAEAVAAHA